MNSSSGLRDGAVAAIVQQLLKARSITHCVEPDDNLADVGLTSLDMARLILLVERAFEISLPVREIKLVNFRSISSIDRLMNRMLKNGHRAAAK